MSEYCFIIEPKSSGLLYKYTKLWLLARTSSRSKWTKKNKIKYFNHSEKIRRHITWLLSCRYKGYKSWQLRILGSDKSSDLTSDVNQEFLFIIYFK